MGRKTVQFKAVKVVKQPTTVQFTTKSGEQVSFKATKGVAQEVSVRFKANSKSK